MARICLATAGLQSNGLFDKAVTTLAMFSSIPGSDTASSSGSLPKVTLSRYQYWHSLISICEKIAPNVKEGPKVVAVCPEYGWTSTNVKELVIPPQVLRSLLLCLEGLPKSSELMPVAQRLRHFNIPGNVFSDDAICQKLGELRDSEIETFRKLYSKFPWFLEQPVKHNCLHTPDERYNFCRNMISLVEDFPELVYTFKYLTTTQCGFLASLISRVGSVRGLRREECLELGEITMVLDLAEIIMDGDGLWDIRDSIDQFKRYNHQELECLTNVQGQLIQTLIKTIAKFFTKYEAKPHFTEIGFNSLPLERQRAITERERQEEEAKKN